MTIRATTPELPTHCNARRTLDFINPMPSQRPAHGQAAPGQSLSERPSFLW